MTFSIHSQQKKMVKRKQKEHSSTKEKRLTKMQIPSHKHTSSKNITIAKKNKFLDWIDMNYIIYNIFFQMRIIFVFGLKRKTPRTDIF